MNDARDAAASPTWRAFIGLGANLGDRFALLSAALDALAHTPGCELRAVARVYETVPVGGATLPFLNSAVELRTSLEPLALMRHLLSIESAQGRRRSELPGVILDRPLDLDLLAGLRDAEPVVLDSPELILPHPRAAGRDFALAPLCELCPSMPIDGRPLHRHLAALGPGSRAYLGIHTRALRLVTDAR